MSEASNRLVFGRGLAATEFKDLLLAIDQAEHKPGQWAATWQEMGGICEPVDLSGANALRLVAEQPKAWGHFAFKRDAWLAVAAVNALPALMADTLLRELALFLDDLPDDLGRGSVNGMRVQLRTKLAARGL